MSRALRSQRRASTNLLKRLIDSPDLARVVEALPAATFSALVRRIGVEDAAELVALATTEQLVEAFDEDLFTNERAGEREAFDSARFVAWLEILLEAGDAAAAKRVAELSESFVVQALSSILLVLDHDTLLQSLSDDSDEAHLADKVIESSLSQEIDGYLLLARKQEGWDAAIALVLALDRDQRDFLERILERCADLGSRYVDDLAELSAVLTDEEALADEVESERETRRTERGFVEPRAARAFLELAKEPLATPFQAVKRDPLTHAYFRDLPNVPSAKPTADLSELPSLVREVVEELAEPLISQPASRASRTLPRAKNSARDLKRDHDVEVRERSEAEPDGELPLLSAMRELSERDPATFTKRVEEFAYLANVVLAGAQRGLDRFSPTEAAEAALATVSFAVELLLREQAKLAKKSRAATPATLFDILRAHSADALFRRASSELHALEPARQVSFLLSRAELADVLQRL